MSLVCSCIYQYLVQVCSNTIQLYIFRCRHRWMLELTGRRWSYPDEEHSSGFGRTSCFWGWLSIIFFHSYTFELVEYIPLAFLSNLFQTFYWCHFGKYTLNAVWNYFFHLMILILDGWLWTFMTLSRMFYMNIEQQKVQIFR